MAHHIVELLGTELSYCKLEACILIGCRMADYERVMYLAYLADNVGIPQTIPQRCWRSVCLSILSDNAAKVLTCCVVPLFAVGNVTARVLIAGNVKPWESGHSAQRRLMRGIVSQLLRCVALGKARPIPASRWRQVMAGAKPQGAGRVVSPV